MPDTARCFSWDYRQQPPMSEIAAFVNAISGGKVDIMEVRTGGDRYAWVVADHEMTDEEAMELYRG